MQVFKKKKKFHSGEIKILELTHAQKIMNLQYNTELLTLSSLCPCALDLHSATF